MKVQLDEIDVDVNLISENEDTLENTYRVVGTVDGVSVDGDVTLFEGGDFEHELGCDDEHLVRIFEHLDGLTTQENKTNDGLEFRATVEEICFDLNLAFPPGREIKGSDVIKVALTDLDTLWMNGIKGLMISEARVSEIHAYLREDKKAVVIYDHDTPNGPNENVKSRGIFSSLRGRLGVEFH